MRVLQTLALPLGYVTMGFIYIICELSGKVHTYFRFRCPHFRVGISGAGYEARTRYLHLGKVALYQMSYTRKFGASGRNRTNDTRIFSPLLYLLSYRGI